MSIEENIKIKDDGLLIKIRISPNASKNQIMLGNEIIKLKVTAQPIENKANKAVIEYLSKLCKVPKSSITIVKGDTSKDKTIFIKVFDKEKIEIIKNTILSE